MGPDAAVARSVGDGRRGGGRGVRRPLPVGVALVGQGGEVALGVEGGGAARAGGGDGLPVLVVDDVAAGEDPGTLVRPVRPCTAT